MRWEINGWLSFCKAQNILHGINRNGRFRTDPVRDFFEQVFFGVAGVSCQEVTHILMGGDYGNVRRRMSLCRDDFYIAFAGHVPNFLKWPKAILLKDDGLWGEPC